MTAQGAAIIAVGSELLTGQITNRNAAWLSSKLFELGIDVRIHLTVDDVEAEIVEALERTRGLGYVFLTGGLGPTSDDLTRQAVARHAGRPLAFDEGSWRHINEIFTRLRATSVPETNRQQCFFPAGAAILVNNAGTANAFTLEAHGSRLFVLPGPPREVETLWNDQVATALARAVPLEARRTVRMWRTIGKGESHLAEIVEPLVQGQGLDVAYRAHAPYIETKLRYPVADAERHAATVQAVEAALTPWLYETDAEDVFQSFATQCAVYRSINLYDGATHGNLAEQLVPKLRERLAGSAPVSVVTSWELHDSPELFVRNCLTVNDDVDLCLAVAGFDDTGQWAVGVRRFDEITAHVRPSPYRAESMRPRNQLAVAYLAVKAFYDVLRGETH